MLSFKNGIYVFSAFKSISIRQQSFLGLVCFLLLIVLHLPGSSAERDMSEAESFCCNVNFGKDNSINYLFMTLIGTCQGYQCLSETQLYTEQQSKNVIAAQGSHHIITMVHMKNAKGNILSLLKH